MYINLCNINVSMAFLTISIKQNFLAKINSHSAPILWNYVFDCKTTPIFNTALQISTFCSNQIFAKIVHIDLKKAHLDNPLVMDFHF